MFKAEPHSLKPNVRLLKAALLAQHRPPPGPPPHSLIEYVGLPRSTGGARP